MNDFSLGSFFISLIFTFIISSLPIMIYRYGIKKEPVERKKALTITIVYGAILLVAELAAIRAATGTGENVGTSVLVWSFFNYSILMAKSKKTEPEEQPKKVYPPLRYCIHCGAGLREKDTHCRNCGKEVEED